MEVACSRCERRGRLSVAKLIDRQGRDARLTKLRMVLPGDCPRGGAAIYEQCGVHYRNSSDYGATHWFNGSSTMLRVQCRMSDFVAEVQGWFEAMSAAERDGFSINPLSDTCFVLVLPGIGAKPVEYGPGILQRGLDAALELLAVEEEQRI